MSFILKKKTDTIYDVSITNLEAKTVECKNNKAYSYKGAGITDWKPETAFELHAPNMIVMDNEAYDCKNGMIHVAWPKSYTSYSTSIGAIIIRHNKFHRVLRGISCWGQHSLSGSLIPTRNMIIDGNYAELRLDATYKPVMGIGFENGDVDASSFENVKIMNNIIELTIADGATYTDGSTLFDQVGGIGLASNNSCLDFEIYGNTFIHFPYSVVNSVAVRVRGTSTHKRINIHNNTFVDCAYVYPNGSIWGGLINLQYTEDFKFKNNKIMIGVNNKTPKEMIHTGLGLSNIEITGNEITGYTSGYKVGFDDLTNYNSIKTDIEVLRVSGAVSFPNINKLTSDGLPSTGNYAVGDTINYKTKCTQKGTVRTLSTQYATWANAHQMYINTANQFIAGDVVIFNGGQIGTVMVSSGNYIYTIEAISSFTAGNCSISAPTFVTMT